MATEIEKLIAQRSKLAESLRKIQQRDCVSGLLDAQIIAGKALDNLDNLDSELKQPVSGHNAKLWSVELHGDGWAIYKGRDSENHGFKLGQLTQTTAADVMEIEQALNLCEVGEQPAVSKWTSCLECFPSDEDFDCNGRIWGLDWDGRIHYLREEIFSCGKKDSDFYAAWMPTGLKKPERPPEWRA